LLSSLARRTVFPYTTLFRSLGCYHDEVGPYAIVEDVQYRPRELDELVAEFFHGAPRGVERPLHVRLHADVCDVTARHGDAQTLRDRKSTRLNSSHVKISYAV